MQIVVLFFVFLLRLLLGVKQTFLQQFERSFVKIRIILIRVNADKHNPITIKECLQLFLDFIGHFLSAEKFSEGRL
jgi:hypothetical protein